MKPKRLLLIIFLCFLVLLFNPLLNAQVAQNSRKPLTFQSALDKGLGHVNNHKYEEAIKAYNEAIGLNPIDPYVYNSLGYAYFLNGQYDQALSNYDQAFKLKPDPALSYQIYINKGAVLVALQQYEKGIRSYNRAMKLNPKDPVAVNARGYAFFLRKEYDKALSDYDQAIRLSSNPVSTYQVYVNQAVVFAARQEFRKAIDAYSRAIEIDSKNPLAFNARGYTYFLQKKYDKALLDYDTAMTLKPNHTLAYDIYLALGLIFAKKHEYSKAREAYKRAMELNPKNKSASRNLSNVFLEMGNTEKRAGRLDAAIQCYSEAILIDSQNPRPYAGRAYGRILKGDKTPAIPDLQTACRLGHQNSCRILSMLQK